MTKLHEQFIINQSGIKMAVVIPYKEYEDLLEDLHDLALIAERKNEKTVSHEEMKKRLGKNGLL